jgi:hypothetical protein
MRVSTPQQRPARIRKQLKATAGNNVNSVVANVLPISCIDAVLTVYTPLWDRSIEKARELRQGRVGYPDRYLRRYDTTFSWYRLTNRAGADMMCSARDDFGVVREKTSVESAWGERPAINRKWRIHNRCF